jgi:hypothetical protein
MSRVQIRSAGLLVVIRQIDSSEVAFSVRGGGLIALVVVAALLTACVEGRQPRSFTEFMDDSIAREGTLVRCNADRAATANDVECINARRAAATIAAQDEAERRSHLEAQSEARLLAARQRHAAQQAAERQAEIAAAVEEQLAYESQWTNASSAELGTTVVAAAPAVEASTQMGSVVPVPSLEPIELPASARPPLTTVRLPRGVKPLEYVPPEPRLEEIVLPSRIKPID